MACRACHHAAGSKNSSFATPKKLCNNICQEWITRSSRSLWRLRSSAQGHQSAVFTPRPNPHSVRCTAAAHLPRFRALALLGRRPPQPVEASSCRRPRNLHNNGSDHFGVLGSRVAAASCHSGKQEQTSKRSVRQRCHSPRHRCHRAGLEGSLGCRALPRVLGYFSSASYFSPNSCFRLMYVMNRIRSASAAA